MYLKSTEEETLRRIIKDVNARNIGNLEEVEEEMVKQLHEFLRGRKYLVVLDDVWEKEVWDSLEAAFPTSGMTEDESLELFCKKSLLGMDYFPSDSENLGREMVTKCGDLPLQVVVLGGLPSRKIKTREEWEHVIKTSVGT
ncbi:PREDICTED: disease resistance protein RPP13-like [Prunus mume]|uniref:Disease resistance protein RPP13-like n=1 Tax=Prunus mume TaxID=102107 RepID=A0ABM1LIA2_PRUMU|nr:PREDICTED: disease resistance protein RPP13-like [Prunus mume]